MKKGVNLLFLNAGRRVELIRRFKEAFLKLHINGRIVTTDIQSLAPALYSGDKRELLPHSSSTEFFPALKSLCQREKIHLIIPLIDPDLLILSRLAGTLQEIGVRVLVSGAESIEICRDKEKTSAFFKKNNFPTVPTYSMDSPDEWKFPMMVKPRDGSSSQFLYKVNSEVELRVILPNVPNPILQKFVEGSEITTDVFSDWSGTPLIAIPRRRLKVRGGEVMVGRVERNDPLENMCLKMAKTLKSIGCINIQAIQTEDTFYFIEINPRFGGGCPLSIAAGAPFAEWTIKMALSEPIASLAVSIKDRTTMMRYDESLFISPEELLV
ncbi:MAG: Carbamoyl-phosphate synthase large chain [Elusimicrobia bacterium]|nr:Carbamoyl-phosphate synthase large chain [Elusimicrobiota bacterium]